MSQSRMPIRITGGHAPRVDTTHRDDAVNVHYMNATPGADTAGFADTLALLHGLPRRTAPPALHSRIISILRSRQTLPM